MRHRGKTPPFRGPSGEVVSGSIAEIAYRRLGGLDQWVMIRGESVANPALILLHGGPGLSETGFFRHFNARLHSTSRREKTGSHALPRSGHDRLAREGTLGHVKEARETLLRRRLADERSGRVVFISHCLLNENTRYLGGAFHAGAVPELVEGFVRAGIGISQMPCPEQRAWGGVLKRLLLRAHGIKGSPLYALRRPLLRIWVAYTQLVYARLAQRVVEEIQDYERSGFQVVGVVGVGSSPSCGVINTLDMHRSLEVIAACPLAAMNRAVMNEQAVAGCQRAGEGIFTRQLRRRLERKGFSVPFVEYDIVAEMRGQPQSTVESLLGTPPARSRR